MRVSEHVPGGPRRWGKLGDVDGQSGGWFLSISRGSLPTSNLVPLSSVAVPELPNPGAD